MRRDVVNRSELTKWAKAQGFGEVQDELHVTLAYSRVPLDWMKIGEAWQGRIELPAGGPRVVEALGDNGAVVLLFNSSELTWRWQQMRDAGAAWEHGDEFHPHITISWKAGDLDLDKVEPYRGKIVLGPEIFSEVDDDWKAEKK